MALASTKGADDASEPSPFLEQTASRIIDLTNDSDIAVHYALGDRGYSLAPRYGRTHKICRPIALRIEWPNDQGSISITPEDGEQFRVARDADGQLRLRHE